MGQLDKGLKCAWDQSPMARAVCKMEVLFCFSLSLSVFSFFSTLCCLLRALPLLLLPVLDARTYLCQGHLPRGVTSRQVLVWRRDKDSESCQCAPKHVQGAWIAPIFGGEAPQASETLL